MTFFINTDMGGGGGLNTGLAKQTRMSAKTQQVDGIVEIWECTLHQ